MNDLHDARVSISDDGDNVSVTVLFRPHEEAAAIAFVKGSIKGSFRVESTSDGRKFIALQTPNHPAQALRSLHDRFLQ